MSQSAEVSAASRSRWSKYYEESSFLRQFLWKYRKLFLMGFGALVVVDVLEILPPLILKEVVDILVQHKEAELLLTWAVIYFGIYAVQSVGRYAWRVFLIKASMLAGRDLRDQYVEHLFSLSASFFERRRIGDLMSLATNDTEAIRRAIGPGLVVFADILLSFITIPVAMFFLSPKLTLLSFIPLIFIPFFVLKNERKLHDRFEKVQESFAHLAALAQENINGIRTVKAFAAEPAQIKRFDEAGRDFIKWNLKLERVQTSLGPVLDFVMATGMVILLYFGGLGVVESTVTIGTYVAFQRYIEKMIWPMSAIGFFITFYQRAVASSDRMKEVFAQKTDVPESARSLSPVTAGQKTKGKIEFKNLSFRFPYSEQVILKNIQLTIEPGQRVAFIGAIGSGKSALLSLLPRMYPVERGMLFIDDVDVNDWPLHELRNQVGYVGQDLFLFSETVQSNLGFGLNHIKDQDALMKLVQNAATSAGVHHDILRFQQSYDTRLGERGVNISGGQKQRITIARAIAKQPSILILDDALSSVDVETEERILRALRQRDGRNTELIAAHRISTIQDADVIVVLKDGEIVQKGTHLQLIQERSGLYQRFYQHQLQAEELQKYVERA